MKGTMSLKEACERASSISDTQSAVLDRIRGINFPEPVQVPIYYEYMRNGKENEVIYCPACGHMEHVERRMYPRTRTTCPCCGNTGIAAAFDGQNTRSYCLQERTAIVIDADRTAGYALIIDMTPDANYVQDSDPGDGELGFLKGKWELVPGHYQRIVFLRGKGFRKINEKSGKLSNADSRRDAFSHLETEKVLYGDCKEEFTGLIADVTGEGCTEENAMKLAAEYSRKIIQENAEKTKKRTSGAAYENLLAYIPDPPTVEEEKRVERATGMSVARPQDTYQYNILMNVHCGFCGTFFDSMVTPKKYGRATVKCPECGNTFKTDTSGNEANENVAKFSVMPDGTFVESVYALTEKINPDGSLNRSTEEKVRVYAAQKKLYRFEKQNGQWKKATNRDRWNRTAVPVQTDDEIKSLIEKSCLADSGLTEAWGLNGETAVEQIGTYCDGYIAAWYKRPYIEKTVKLQMRKLTKEIISGVPAILEDAKANAVTKVFGINKPLLNMAREKDLNASEIMQYRDFYNMDCTLTADEYGEAMKIAYPYAFKDLKQDYGIPLKKALDYLQNVYDRQCIEKRKALQEWSDYLHMAKLLQYDLKEKDKKYPDSLRKEHDRAVFAYKRVENEINREQFAKQYEKNKVFEYASGDFIIRVPKTAEEVIGEAEQQSNCVASYVDRICRGATTIVFLRKKENPDRSYVTVQITKDKIVQFYGFANSKVKDPETLGFIREFAKKKGLEQSFA